MTDLERNILKEKARRMRYAKPMMDMWNYESIMNSLSEMQDDCNEVIWAMDDKGQDILADILGDEDEAYQFKIEFSDLEYQLERMQEQLGEYDSWEYSGKPMSEYFDIMLVGKPLCASCTVLGYDEFETDYYSLNQDWEIDSACDEAVKKVTSLKKKEIVELMHRVFQVCMSYADIRFKYQCLKYSLDLIRDQTGEEYKSCEKINEIYEKGDKECWKDVQTVWKFDSVLRDIPDKTWIQ